MSPLEPLSPHSPSKQCRVAVGHWHDKSHIQQHYIGWVASAARAQKAPLALTWATRQVILLPTVRDFQSICLFLRGNLSPAAKHGLVSPRQIMLLPPQGFALPDAKISSSRQTASSRGLLNLSSSSLGALC